MLSGSRAAWLLLPAVLSSPQQWRVATPGLGRRSGLQPEAVVAREVEPEEPPATHKLILGDWIAQWDPTYTAWFFFNIKSEESTWVKPKELQHVVFNAPSKTPGLPQQGVGKGPRKGAGRATNGIQSVYPPANLAATRFQQYPAQEKVLIESTAGDFFGYNTTSFQTRGIIGGLQDSLTGIYDNIVKDYVTDVYTDVIEGYTIATIKLMGWFFFGSFLIFKGAMLGALNDQAGRSLEGVGGLTRSVTGRVEADGGPVNYTLPFIQDLRLTFPVDNSLMNCYQGRPTCVANDLPGELDAMLTSGYAVWDLASRWMNLSEKIGDMVVEGEAEF